MRKAIFAAVALVVMSLAVPPALFAQQQKAGEITKQIQPASVNRGGKGAVPAGVGGLRRTVASITGAPDLQAQDKMPILWKDILWTGSGGRMRAMLNDGSIISVGPESILTVTEYNEHTQQSAFQLNYGKVRAQVVKMTRPDSRFEIRTNTAVCGVLGTDEYVDASNPASTLVVNLSDPSSLSQIVVRNADPSVPGTVVLNPGEATRVDAGRPPQGARRASQDEVNTANEQTATGTEPEPTMVIQTATATATAGPGATPGIQIEAGTQVTLDARTSNGGGTTITSYAWAIPRRSFQSTEPVLNLDTTGWPPAAYDGTLTITNAQNKSATMRFQVLITASTAGRAAPQEAIEGLRQAYEALQVTKFMAFFSPDYPGYSALESSTTTSFANIASNRVYLRKSNGQVTGATAIFQVDFEVRFLPKTSAVPQGGIPGMTATAAAPAFRTFDAAPTTSISGNAGAVATFITLVNLTTGTRLFTNTGTGLTYSFTNLAPGRYEITPARAGFVFQPASRVVDLTAAGATGMDFTASGQEQVLTETVTMNLQRYDQGWRIVGLTAPIGSAGLVGIPGVGAPAQGTSVTVSGTTGTGGGVLSMADFNVLIAAGAFTSVMRGGASPGLTVTIDPQNGFTGTVTLNLLLPTGITATSAGVPGTSFTIPVTSGSASRTFTFSSDSTAALGTITIGYQATAGTLNKTGTLVTYQLYQPAIAMPQGPYKIYAGGFALVLPVTVTTAAGITTPITVSASGPGITSTAGTVNGNGAVALTLISPGTALGPVPLTISATGAGIAYSVQITLDRTAPFSFSVPSSIALAANLAGTVPVQFTFDPGFHQPVTITPPILSGFTFNPSSLTPSASGSDAFAVTATTVGSASGSFTASAGTYVVYAPVNFNVSVPVDFSISAPPSLSLYIGRSRTIPITVTQTAGTAATITVSASGVDASKLTVTVQGNGTTTGSGTVNLDVAALKTAAAGPTSFTVTGQVGNVTKTTTVTLTLGPAPAFAIAVAADSPTIAAGGIGATVTVTITAETGYAGTVTIAPPTPPAGWSITLAPNNSSTVSFTNGGTATSKFLVVVAAGTAPTAQPVPLTFSAQDPYDTKTAPVSILVVKPFTISAPQSATLFAGLTGQVTVNVSFDPNYTGSVTISAATVPSILSKVVVSGTNNTSATVSKGTSGTASVVFDVSPGAAAGGPASLVFHAADAQTSADVTVAVTVNLGFTVAANADTTKIAAGGLGAAVTVTVTAPAGYVGTVAVTRPTAPTGFSIALASGSNPNPSFSNGGTATTTYRVLAQGGMKPTTAPVTFTFTAKGGALTQTADVALSVVAPFTLSVPASLRLSAGVTSQITASVTFDPNYPGPLTLTASSVPSVLTSVLSDGSSSVSVSKSGTAPVAVPFEVQAGNTAGGPAALVFTASDTSSNSATASTTVTVGAGYSISAAAATSSIAAGGLGTLVTVTITAPAGYAGDVIVTPPAPPSGFSITLAPESSSTVSFSNGGTAMVQFLVKAAAGTSPTTQTLQFRALGGTLAQTASLALTVNRALTLSAPTSLSVTAGSSLPVTVTVSFDPNYVGSVIVGPSSLPSILSQVVVHGTTSSTATIASSASPVSVIFDVTGGSPGGPASLVFNVTDMALNNLAQASVSASVTVPFVVTSSLTSSKIYPGGTTTANLTISGGTGTVTVAAPSIPGLTFNPTQNTVPGSGNLSFTITADQTAVGAQSISFTVTQSGIPPVATTPMALNVAAPFQLPATIPATAFAGSAQTVPVNVTFDTGFTGSVTLSVPTSMPSGLQSASLSPTLLTSSGPSNLTLTALSTATGTATLVVTATTTGYTTTSTVNITYSAPFTAAVSADTTTIAAGGVGAVVTVTVTPATGFTGSVTVAPPSPPSGFNTITLQSGSNAVLNLSGGTPQTSKWVVTSPAGTPATTAAVALNFTVQNGITQTASVSMNIVKPFTIAAATSAGLFTGGGGSVTVTVTFAANYTGSVTLSAGTLPLLSNVVVHGTGSGVTVVPNSTSPVPVVFDLTAGTAAGGPSPVIFTATNGVTADDATASTQVSVTTSFSAVASADFTTIASGGAGAVVTVTVTPASGLTGSVTVVPPSPPSGFNTITLQSGSNSVLTFTGGVTPQTSKWVVTSPAGTMATTVPVPINFTVQNGITQTASVSISIVKPFTISVGAAANLFSGATSSVTVTVTFAANYTGSVTLSAGTLPLLSNVVVHGAPSGTTPVPNSTSPVPVVFDLTAGTTAGGPSPLTFTATNGVTADDATASTQVSVTTAFTAAIAADTATIAAGGVGAVVTVTVTPGSGFTGSVNIVPPTPPSGFSITLQGGSNSVLTFSGGGAPQTSKWVVTSPAGTPATTTPAALNFTAQNTISLPLSVSMSIVKPFTITVDAAANLFSGATGSVTVTVTFAANYTGSVTLSAGTLSLLSNVVVHGTPSGTTPVPNSTSPVPVVFDLTASTTAGGPSPLAFTATNGVTADNATGSTQVTVTTPFTVAPSVDFTTIAAGGVGAVVTITVTPASTFTGSVTVVPPTPAPTGFSIALQSGSNSVLNLSGGTPQTSKWVVTSPAGTPATTTPVPINFTVQNSITQPASVSLNIVKPFTIAAGASASLFANVSGPVTVTVTFAANYTGSVTLSAGTLSLLSNVVVHGTGSGTTVVPNNTSPVPVLFDLTAGVTAGGPSPLTFTASNGVTADNATASTQVTVTTPFTAAISTDFTTIAAAGAGAIITITVTPASGYSGSVTVQPPAPQPGFAVALKSGSNSVLTLSGGTPQSSLWVITAAPTTAPTTNVPFGFTVSNSIQVPLSVSLNVEKPFTLAVDPAVQVFAGATGTVTVTVTWSANYVGSISLQPSTVPTAILSQVLAPVTPPSSFMQLTKGAQLVVPEVYTLTATMAGGGPLPLIFQAYNASNSEQATTQVTALVPFTAVAAFDTGAPTQIATGGLGTTLAVNVTYQNGYAGSVTVSPPSVTGFAVDPSTPIVLSAQGAAKFVVKANAGITPAPTNFTFPTYGLVPGGSYIVTPSPAISVPVAAAFTLTPSPSSLSLAAGQVSTITFSVAFHSNYQGTVTVHLPTPIAPLGSIATSAGSNMVLLGTGNVKLDATAGPTAGSASLTFTATDTVGNTATAVVPTAVTGSISGGGAVSPGPVTAPAGSTAVIPVDLVLNPGTYVDSLNFGIQVVDGSSNLIQATLGFALDPTSPFATASPPASVVVSNSTPGQAAVLISLSGSTSVSGTMKLGSISFTVPSGATSGQNYTVTIVNPSGSLGGTTNITLTPGPGSTFTVQRTSGGGFQLMSVKDAGNQGLSIQADSLTYSPSFPREGDTVRFRVQVRNGGRGDADSALALVSGDRILARQQLSVAAGRSTAVELEWKAEAVSDLKLALDSGRSTTATGQGAVLPLKNFAVERRAGAGSVSRERLALQARNEDCVGLRLQSGMRASCGGSADLELSPAITDRAQIEVMAAAFGGGIAHLGVQSLSTIRSAPLDGYQPQGLLETGHTYALKTRGGYALFRVVRVSSSVDPRLVALPGTRAGSGSRRTIGIVSDNPIDTARDQQMLDRLLDSARITLELEWLFQQDGSANFQ
jgi:hypothetical protein